MLTLTKKELIAIGFGPSQSADIIRRSKRLMVSKGFGYYTSKRLGRVPVKAVEEVLGICIADEKGELVDATSK
ncbi:MULTISPECIES: DUF3173 domain-containing protein [Lactobacillaceae]|uniref:DUF3173 domain-containing protein n=2 Tax=Lactobacillaceae TaxID=33958 RepID=A0A9X2FMC2_9LACO|nr:MULTISPECIES: DUF3173 domain-containing protein [Lactobacillaceae]KRL04919.1 hypothetical protein FC92_GL001751 [Liquorilactobacillus hordei DSM 19519]MCC7667182.1 DUF3173 domain-containing protein [Liquorilactobacillus satsumensis]MCP0887915.1 DUF3173 domain-containing protein [Ligilactobacillus ubinensis]MCP9315001.1 DUF3173 domain-containing protein [Liquorilactobacillus nagelii]QYH51645.1 DUF3173 family protein [Liquorilactobacillus hordei DSM 19519]